MIIVLKPNAPAGSAERLLSKIEDSLRFWKVFGFAVSNVSVTVGDLNAIKVCCQLVPKIFDNLRMAPKKLALSIKARIAVYVHSILRFLGMLFMVFIT